MTRTLRWGTPLLFALFALLRIELVDQHGLWHDELFSLAMSTGHSLEHAAASAKPELGDYVEAPRALPPSDYGRYLEHETPPADLSRVVRAVALSDTSPPLYYALLHGWTRALGTSDATLRFFSVMWALACFPLLWSLARQIGGDSACLPVSLLFAVSPLAIYYSTEVRMYSMMLFLSIAMIWLSLRIRRKGPDAWTVVLWIASGIAGLLTHYFYLFLWAAAVFWLQLYPGAFARKLSLCGAILVVLLVLPWYLQIPEMVSQWRVTSYWLERRPHNYDALTSALLLPWNFLSIQVVWTWGIRDFWEWLNAAAFVILGIFVVRSSSWPPSPSPTVRLLWLWLLAPCLGLIAFDLLRGTFVVTVPRYAIAGLPAAFLLAGIALGRLSVPLRPVAVGVVALIWTVGSSPMYLTSARLGQKFRETGRLLAEQAHANQLVLVHSIPGGVAGIARYMGQYGDDSADVGYASWVGQLKQRRVPEDLLRLAAGRKQIILVKVHAVWEPAPEKDWLDENARLVDWKKIGKVMLYYYLPRDAEEF